MQKKSADGRLEPLLALSRKSESSVVPTIEAFIGRAIRNTYEVGDKIITGYIPGISFIDRGHYAFDEFYLKDLRHLRKTD